VKTGFRTGRRGLLDACQALKIGTKTTVRSGPNRGTVKYRTGPASDLQLACLILEKVYGPGIDWNFETMEDAATRALRAAECYLGHYGEMLQQAAECLASAQIAGKKWAEFRSRGKGDSGPARKHLKECKDWLKCAGVCQQLHELEAAMLDTDERKAAFKVALVEELRQLQAERIARSGLPDMRNGIAKRSEEVCAHG
jgi:hypothetical protein